ncbi:cutinase family protein [Salinibacterium sp. ZJ70]|uniref:cutinase family protein n=1 Tax=Salinibacterium sp. ZJ70 TaxID=2708084 RepID=UPI001420F59F|nr:cutinase family protein [Salinibacterium sp. ZJ70]
MARARWTAKRWWIVGGAMATVVGLIAAYVVIFAMPKYGEFDQRIEAGCEPVIVLAFRGSGEGNLTPGVTANSGAPHRYGDSDLVTNGWEGVTLDGLFDALSTTVYGGFEADQIPVVSIGPAGEDEPFGYEAIRAEFEASSLDSAFTYSSSKLLHSASRGAEAATHLISEHLRAAEGCPIEPKFIVVGYSQGAMAARHTAELNQDDVIGVFTIGDPYQQAEAPGVRDAGAVGTGIIRWKADEAQRAALDAFYRAVGHHSGICHADDPICQFVPFAALVRLALGDYAPHLDYYSDGSAPESRQDALEIARLAAERWKLALDAQRGGSSLGSACERASEAAPALRTTSLAFAGTPTLVSASASARGCDGVRFEFDLDGDGTFETTSTTGSVWVDFGEPGMRGIGVRVTHPVTGPGPERRITVPVAPAGSGDLDFDETGLRTPPPAAEPTTPVADPPPPRTARPPAQRPAPAPAPAPPSAPAPNPEPEPSPTPAPNRGSLVIDPDPLYNYWYFVARGAGYPPGVELLVSWAEEYESTVWTDESGGFDIELDAGPAASPKLLIVESVEGAVEVFRDVFEVEVLEGAFD